ncbi:unnamed protein product, partial [Mesorhabditis spiculigera]
MLIITVVLAILWPSAATQHANVREDPNPLLRVQPTLECLPDGMRLHLSPIGPFSGHVYVKGYFNAPPESCHLDYCRAPVSSPFYIHIPYKGHCMVSTQKTANPPGINYQVTVIVQHHHFFVTAGDRAYRLNCLYEEKPVTLRQQVNVKEMQPTNLGGTAGASHCRYDVLGDGVDGARVRLASIGQPIVHRWTCNNEDVGFLVHSCSVKDEQGKDYELVDDRGCPIDGSIVPALEYSVDLHTVHTTINAFRFADQLLVHFSCQLTLCEKRDNGCEGIVVEKQPEFPVRPDPEDKPEEVGWTDAEGSFTRKLAAVRDAEVISTTKPASKILTGHLVQRYHQMQREEAEKKAAAEQLLVQITTTFPTPTTLDEAFEMPKTTPSPQIPDSYHDYFTTQRIPTGFRYYVPIRFGENRDEIMPAGRYVYTTPPPAALPIRHYPPGFFDYQRLGRFENSESLRRYSEDRDTYASSHFQNVQGGFRFEGDVPAMQEVEHYRAVRKTVTNSTTSSSYETLGRGTAFETTIISARIPTDNEKRLESRTTRLARNLDPRNPVKTITIGVETGPLLVVSSEEGFPTQKSRREAANDTEEAEPAKQTMPSDCPHLIFSQFIATLIFTLLQLATLSVILVQRRKLRALQKSENAF